MKIAIINSSHPVYNLAIDRMQYKLGQTNEVIRSGKFDMFQVKCDEAYISAIFTWDLPRLIYDVKAMKEVGIPNIQIGGPAVTAMADYVEQETGLPVVRGLDQRFEIADGNYLTTFTSRGCPRACEFCLVPKLEGRKMVEYDNFPIPTGVNPWVCDNNILATSWQHQTLVVDKLRHIKNLDINSGFDDRIFLKNPDKYWDLYSQLHLERWRFAYDKPEQRDAIKQCSDFLHNKNIRYSNISVFCLIGGYGETFDEARERLEYLISIDVTPYPQRYKPLNSLTRDYNPPNWKNGAIELLFQFYGVPNMWRSMKWEEFIYKDKKAGDYQGMKEVTDVI